MTMMSSMVNADSQATTFLYAKRGEKKSLYEKWVSKGGNFFENLEKAIHLNI